MAVLAADGAGQVGATARRLAYILPMERRRGQPVWAPVPVADPRAGGARPTVTALRIRG